MAVWSWCSTICPAPDAALPRTPRCPGRRAAPDAALPRTPIRGSGDPGIRGSGNPPIIHSLPLAPQDGEGFVEHTFLLGERAVLALEVGDVAAEVALLADVHRRGEGRQDEAGVEVVVAQAVGEVFQGVDQFGPGERGRLARRGVDRGGRRGVSGRKRHGIEGMEHRVVAEASV